MSKSPDMAHSDRLARKQRDALTAERKATLTRSAMRIADLVGPAGLADHDALLTNNLGMPKTHVYPAPAREKDVYE